MILKKNKKANMTYQESIIIIVSLVVVAFSLMVIVFASSNVSEKVAEYHFKISYKFPAAFVQEFLYQKVDEKYLEELNLDNNKEYFVKDIIQIKKLKSKKIVENIRNDFIEKEKLKLSKPKNALNLFEEFSKSKINLNSLLDIEYISINNFKNLNLEDSIKNLNYFYYFYTEDNEIVLVYFKNPKV